MTPTPLDLVLARLREADVPRTHVSKATGVPIQTLNNLAQGVTTDPRFSTVWALYTYFEPGATGAKP